MKNSVLCYLEQTASKYKDKTAIIDKNGELSFGDMKSLALKTANAIINLYDGIQRPILVFLPKLKESFAVFMGIVYSRNIYVPTDVKYPSERILSLVEILKPALIISDKKYGQKLSDYGIDIPLLLLENIMETSCELKSFELSKQSLLSDLVYIIFTSGSTGSPKGVSISNLNIIEYIDWVTEVFHSDENTVMGSLAPLYFDLSTHELYTCLAKASTLVMIPEKYKAFPAAILKYLKEKHVNFLYWVPSAYVNVATFNLLESVKLDEIKTMVFGGEVMPVKTLNYWRKNLPSLSLVANMYGPTEATVNCTYYIVDREFGDDEFLPLGKPCDIKEIIVLDEEEKKITPEQAGTIGELCVCGTSLSRGYWNNPEKTSQFFVQNPLNPYLPEIMYRTGDLVYYNEQGELVFAGRKDFQIKHMGYRLELGEIESAILQTQIVDNACVLYDSMNKSIVLTYCAANEIDRDLLVKKLADILPQYAIPSRYEYIRSFPMTESGKIDRQYLSKRYLKNDDGSDL